MLICNVGGNQDMVINFNSLSNILYEVLDQLVVSPFSDDHIGSMTWKEFW
jgi:hypothetical protein